jgi:hypothetical protein
MKTVLELYAEYYHISPSTAKREVIEEAAVQHCSQAEILTQWQQGMMEQSERKAGWVK